MPPLPPPLALIAELTHRCPLHCVYCSNPLEMQSRAEELETAAWLRVIQEAGALGVVQLHLTGGEPLVRADLVELVTAARIAGLYTNLITSGLGLEAKRLAARVAAGLDHLQLSFQDADADAADLIAGTAAHQRKLALARRVREHARLAFTANVVVHRQNLDRLPAIIAMAEELGVDRLEIAHVQYYAWALENRARLLPTRDQVERSVALVAAAQQRLAGRLRIEMVVPDYYARFPKPCMGGWGRQAMLLDPRGRALPCHAAAVLPGLHFDNVQDKTLRWIWEESSAFQAFRGTAWMQEPCQSCDRREQDFGGCRCQAFLLAGNAAVTDPVCSLSPDRPRVDAALEPPPAADLPWVYRS
ncbi:MAG: pyrroloquinoline quinone biosynthesis protein PqqE, partial [Terriglobales bacterium]